MSSTIYFDDLFVGRKFRSEAVEVTAEEMIRFSKENDPQYFHVDAQAARESLFGGLIGSGWQTAALTLRLLLFRSDVTFAGGVIGAETRISWKRPVRPGDRLHIEGSITKLVAPLSRPDRGFASFQLTTFNQEGIEVQTLEATILVFKDPARKGETKETGASATFHKGAQ
jgi:acyl dehydratase